MADRLYTGYLVNPISDHLDEVQKLVDNGTLTPIFEDPSVTTISKARGLGWSFIYSAVALTKQGKDFKEEWGKAADKGTLVHQAAENLYAFGAEGFSFDSYPQEIHGYLQALVSWWKVYQPLSVKQEFMVWSRKHAFAGRADMLFSKANKRFLVDWKTVGKPEHLKRYPKAFVANRMELVARAFAMKEMGMHVDTLAIVRLAADGQKHHYEIPQADWQPLFDAFLRCRQEFDFCKVHDA